MDYEKFSRSLEYAQAALLGRTPEGLDLDPAWAGVALEHHIGQLETLIGNIESLPDDERIIAQSFINMLAQYRENPEKYFMIHSPYFDPDINKNRLFFIPPDIDSPSGQNL